MTFRLNGPKLHRPEPIEAAPGRANRCLRGRRPGIGPALGLGLTLTLALGLGGCAVQWQNTQAAQEVARKSEPPGSVYAGWRVFQDRCAACHGADATGSASAPDLRVRVRELGERRFMSLVLTRYDWNQAEAIESGPARGSPAQVDEVLQRRKGAFVMPAWEGEPRVTAHIGDLYAYLAARAEGTQGPGRPQR